MTSAAEAGGGLAIAIAGRGFLRSTMRATRARGDALGPNEGRALRAWRRGLSYPLSFPVDNDSQVGEA